MNTKELQLLTVDCVHGGSSDPELLEAVQRFCVERFGEPFGTTELTKILVVVEEKDSDPRYIVHGVAAITLALDCPMFHVRAEKDHDNNEQARAVRDMLVEGAAMSIGRGTEIFVYVAPDQQTIWDGFLQTLKAKAADRFIVKV